MTLMLTDAKVAEVGKRFKGLLLQLPVTFADLPRGLDEHAGPSGAPVCCCRMCVSRTAR